MLRTGTSGFAYKEWKGAFYPADLPGDAMLAYYAERLAAVEINNTFYRMPKESVLRGWAEQVPDEFRFVLKASRQITHLKRLKDVADPVAYLMRTAGALEHRLGPLLFQLPPNLKKDLDRLASLLALIPNGRRAALEFRHASWHDDDVHALLRDHDAALCIAEDEEGAAPRVATAAWGYLRLRRQDYDDARLADWAGWSRAQPWSETYVFFKHEDAAAGPRLARRFGELYEATD